MNATLRIAWRNLGRNRRRTVITGSALALGICLSVATFGITDGMISQLLESLTRLSLGHVQIHHPEYPQGRALRHTIEAPEPLLASIRADAEVAGAAARVYGFALVSSHTQSVGAELIGVDPAAEPRVTVLHERVVAGRYLDPEPTPWPRGRELTAEERAEDEALTRAEEEEVFAELEELKPLGANGRAGADPTEEPAAPAPSADTADVTRALAETLSPPPERAPRVLVGATLAKVLGVRVGDRIHATGQTVDGASEDVYLEIGGIYQTGTAAFDRGRLYMHLADLQRFTHLYDRVHEIALTTADPEAAPGYADRLEARLGPPLLVRSWDEIRPDMSQMLRVSRVGTMVMVFIIFFVATLGVVNTMLMAVFERTRELGVLKAIGMSGGRIVRLIVVETLLLVLAASIVGTALGLLLDLYLVHYGLDLRSMTGGISIAGVGMDPVLYGEITVIGLVMPTLILSATSLIASLYPAIRAARLRPAVGMRDV